MQTMPRRANKTRKLWLQIKVKAPGESRRNVLTQLIRSIHKGDYKYPSHWRVGIRWSNKSEADMVARPMSEFTREMIKSAQSSGGWDIAVEAYLESQL